MFLSKLESMFFNRTRPVEITVAITIESGPGNDNYRSILGKDITAVEGNLAICDGMSVISSIIWGPDFKSRITSSTTEVLFAIYVPPGIETDYIETDLRRLEEGIKTFSSSSVRANLQVFSKD